MGWLAGQWAGRFGEKELLECGNIAAVWATSAHTSVRTVGDLAGALLWLHGLLLMVAVGTD